MAVSRGRKAVAVRPWPWGRGRGAVTVAVAVAVAVAVRAWPWEFEWGAVGLVVRNGDGGVTEKRMLKESSVWRSSLPTRLRWSLFDRLGQCFRGSLARTAI